MKMKHDVKKLPKWAQDQLRLITRQRDNAELKLKVMESPHIVLKQEDGGSVHIWRFEHNSPVCITTLLKGDVLFVARNQRR